MKVFLIAQRNEKNSKQLDIIKNILNSLGHKINDDTITQKEAEQDFTKLINKIKNSDIVIAESTGSNSSIGFLISAALGEKKYILFLEQKGDLCPNLFKSTKSKILSIREYTDDNLQPLIEEFCSSSEDKLDTKFILIISPEIDKYLEWKSEHSRMHKAQIVRASMEKTMKEDKEYQS